MSAAVDVSVVIPLKDEEGAVEPLAAEIAAVMNNTGWSWECVWVDDGSSDGSLEALRRLHRFDPRHRYISFEANAGQSAALWAGFREARGPVIATIDADGQNDPSDLPGLAEMVMTGQADMANGYRAKRRDSAVRFIASRLANWFRNLTTGRSVRDVGCSTRAFSRECLEGMPQFKGMHRFFPTLAALHGKRLAEKPVNHRPRLSGRSKYAINNRLWVGLYDSFGVMWLRKRNFEYRTAERSDTE